MKRDILRVIRDNMEAFSKGQRQIAHYLLDHYEKAAYMTAAKLSSEASVSESTVVRFVMELGFAGYPEFQRALQELIRTRLTSFQRMEVTNQLIGNGDVPEKVLLSEMDRIRHTVDTLDRKAFSETVNALTNARTIYVLGVRSSAMLASFFCYNLSMIFDNVRLIETTAGSEIFQQIMNIGPGDVMAAFSFPRYSKRVVKAVEFAGHAGADVVALTDSEHSPIASSATHLLIAKSDMVSFVDSLVAPLSLIDALIVGVSRANEPELKNRLRRLEEIWDEYDVYDKNQG